MLLGPDLEKEEKMDKVLRLSDVFSRYFWSLFDTTWTRRGTLFSGLSCDREVIKPKPAALPLVPLSAANLAVGPSYDILSIIEYQARSETVQRGTGHLILATNYSPKEGWAILCYSWYLVFFLIHVAHTYKYIPYIKIEKWSWFLG